MTTKPHYILVPEPEFQRMLGALDSPPVERSGEAIYSKAEDMRAWLQTHPADVDTAE